MCLVFSKYSDYHNKQYNIFEDLLDYFFKKKWQMQNCPWKESFSNNAFPVVCFTSKVNVWAWFWMWFKFKLSCKNIETISYNIDKVQDLVNSVSRYRESGRDLWQDVTGVQQSKNRLNWKVSHDSPLWLDESL